MSQLDSTNVGGIYEEKPGSNIYTALLGIAFMALCAATALLSMELQDYEFDTKAANAKKVVVPTQGRLPEPPAVEGESTDGTDPNAVAPDVSVPDPNAAAPAVPAAAPTDPSAMPAAPGVAPAVPGAAAPAVPGAPTAPAVPAAAPAVPGAAPAAPAP